MLSTCLIPPVIPLPLANCAINVLPQRTDSRKTDCRQLATDD